MNQPPAPPPCPCSLALPLPSLGGAYGPRQGQGLAGAKAIEGSHGHGPSRIVEAETNGETAHPALGPCATACLARLTLDVTCANGGVSPGCSSDLQSGHLDGPTSASLSLILAKHRLWKWWLHSVVWGVPLPASGLKHTAHGSAFSAGVIGVCSSPKGASSQLAGAGRDKDNGRVKINLSLLAHEARRLPVADGRAWGTPLPLQVTVTSGEMVARGGDGGKKSA